MSWDADLICSHGATIGGWNYTHNTNGMIAAAIEAAGDAKVDQCSGPLGPPIGPAWWDRLNGMSGAEGHFLLRRILEQLEADPARYRAMNPENGWGDYDSLVRVLSDMRDRCAVETDGTKWEVSG